MALLERHEWYDIARSTNWTPSYVGESELFPDLMTGAPGALVSKTAWRDVAALALPGAALAQGNEIVIGISVSTTGPAAALGIPERNSLEFVAKEIGGVPLKVFTRLRERVCGGHQ